ncbi:MAG: ArnT family glycosyltransferase [Planctomycetota bacterium]
MTADSTATSRHATGRWLTVAWAFLAIGLCWRVGRYLLDFPIWGDEAMVALNLPGRDYFGLLHGLDHCQVAPPLWLWSEKAAFELLGPSTLSLRLAPLMAGCAALVLHGFWAWSLAPGRAAALATGLMAVAIWPASMSTLIKPYSFDLLAAMLILAPATRAIADPASARWIAVTAIAAPMAILLSFPAMFVAGAAVAAIAIVALPGNTRARLAFALLAAFTLAGSLASLQVGHNQLESPTGADGVTTRQGMDAYWGLGFPPKGIIGWLPWFLGAITGQMMAFPAGAANGGSMLTTLAFLIGAATLVRARRWTLVALLVLPMALNLVAAIMHRYPFGSSGRLCQALAPSICLLAGLGADRAMALGCPRWRLVPVAVATALAGLGIGGLAKDWLYPYRDPVFVWMRSVMDDATDAAGRDTVVIRHVPDALEAVFTYRWRTSNARATWGNSLPENAASTRRLWVFHQKGNPVPVGPSPLEALRAMDPAWTETGFRHWNYPSPRPDKSPSLSVEMVLVERR